MDPDFNGGYMCARVCPLYMIRQRPHLLIDVLSLSVPIARINLSPRRLIATIGRLRLELNEEGRVLLRSIH